MGYIKCKNCKNGAADCPKCKGRGHTSGLLGVTSTCSHSGGSGHLRCNVCSGTGKVRT